MTVKVIRNTHPTLPDIRDVVNAVRVQIGAGSNYHIDKSERSVTAANASTLATLLTLTKALCEFVSFHFADDVLHKVKDATALPTSASVNSLATAITALNAIKVAWGTHIASTTYHYTADAVNTIAAANASDQGTSETLANELKADMNTHSSGALAGPALGQSIRLDVA